MKNNIKDFLKLYNQDKLNEKIYEETSDFHLKQYIDFTSFYLTSYTSCGVQINRTPNDLIQLDEEDLQYFINKYSPKIEDEYQEQLRKLNKEYGK